MACPAIFLAIVLEISALFLGYGFLFNKSGVGGSVASAKLANVSIIKFTHNICTAFNGESPVNVAPIKATTTATTLTVS